MARVSLERAYPHLTFRPKSRNWWAKFTGAPAECIHLDFDLPWMATFLPDTLYVRGKAVPQRVPARPEVSLCRECLFSILEPELAAHPGRVVAFEPDPESFTQYFFIGMDETQVSGVQEDVSTAIRERLAENWGTCTECRHDATWLWIPREQVESLDDVEGIRKAEGVRLCARHGAGRFCAALENIPQANVYYMNVPYGEAGAYFWI